MDGRSIWDHCGFDPPCWFFSSVNTSRPNKKDPPEKSGESEAIGEASQLGPPPFLAGSGFDSFPLAAICCRKYSRAAFN